MEPVKFLLLTGQLEFFLKSIQYNIVISIKSILLISQAEMVRLSYTSAIW